MTLEGVMRGAEEGPGVLAFDLPPPAEDGGGGGGGGANEAAAGVSLKVDFPKQAWFYLASGHAGQAGGLCRSCLVRRVPPRSGSARFRRAALAAHPPRAPAHPGSRSWA